jgi:hypothetical protein
MAPHAVESMFAEIELLVLEGDAAGLAARVSELSAERRPKQHDPQDPAGTATDTPREGPGRQTTPPEGEQPQDARRDSPAPLVHSPGS